MDYYDFIPQDFKSLMMPKKQKQKLLDCIEMKTLPGRIAILGPTGSGKSTLAHLIAKAMNCIQFKSLKDICGQCEACTRQSDLTIIDCADPKRRSNMLVELKRANSFKPFYNKRVLILDEAQILSGREQASLLLPIENVHYLQVIICSSRIDDISIPLRTRFVQIEMIRPSVERAFRYYRRRLEIRNVIISDYDLHQIIEKSDRLPREIVKRILEQQFAYEARS